MLDCDKITNKTKSLMFKLIEETDKDGIERGIFLCEKAHEEIISSDICVGGVHSIGFTCECPKNTRYKGRYHTHPPEKLAPTKYPGAPSHRDIINAAASTKDSQSFCIGYSNSEKSEIKCFDINDKKLSELGDKVGKLIQKEVSEKGDEERARLIIRDMQTRLNELVYGPTAEISELYGWRTDKPDILNTKCALTK